MIIAPNFIKNNTIIAPNNKKILSLHFDLIMKKQR